MVLPGIDSIGFALLLGSLAISPLMILIFRPREMGDGFWANLFRMLRDYWIHLALFGAIYLLKGYVDSLNDPVRGVFGDFTGVLYTLEGDLVLIVQQAFQHPWLTAVLNFNYLFGYIFLTYFSFILMAYADDRELAGKMVLNVFVIYLLATPFYTFFNVQITSDYIPAMKALLYHSSADYLGFFTAADPFDNAWPSLHIAIPYGFFLLMFWTMRRRGHTIETWGYRRYLWVVIAEICIFTFSILYLGIHWILDVPGGLLVGYLGALIVEEIHGPTFEALERWADQAGSAIQRSWASVRSRFGERT